MIGYIRRRYLVPAKVGGRVRYTGDPGGPIEGTITSAPDAYLRVRPDGVLGRRRLILHPTWCVEYLTTKGGP